MSRLLPRLALAGAGVGAAVALNAGRAVLADAERRERLERSWRVYALSTRRSAHFAWVRVRGARADEEARARLEQQFAIRSAEDVARELGQMKGAIMKVGQMVSFLAEGLPPEAQAALATLQADVPPMAPSLAAQVVREELGDEPEALFLDWDPVPVAAASVGQVHRAVLQDGRKVAVKVQYPGVNRAIGQDLDSAELLYGMFASVALHGLDVKGLVDELRARMADELDYRIEAANQREFAERFRGHPFVHVPDVVPERSAARVLTSEWVDGWSWAEFEEHATPAARRTAAEAIFRFAQSSVFGVGVFNGDPHPGNYKFHKDGRVTFLDFGLVKRWAPGELEQLAPALDAILDRDPEGTVRAMQEAGFLTEGADVDPALVFDYVSTPYVPYLSPTFTFSRKFVPEALGRIMDLKGPHAEVIKAINMPPSFVILDRVVWGVSALLGKLDAEAPWRGILAEYRDGGPPATELGQREAEWRAQGPSGRGAPEAIGGRVALPPR